METKIVHHLINTISLGEKYSFIGYHWIYGYSTFGYQILSNPQQASGFTLFLYPLDRNFIIILLLLEWPYIQWQPMKESYILLLETEISQIFLWWDHTVSPKLSTLDLAKTDFAVNFTMTSHTVSCHKTLMPIWREEDWNQRCLLFLCPLGHLVFGSSVRNSIVLINKMRYLKFGWSYSNWTWTVSSFKGCSRFTDITCPWGGAGSKCRT